MNLVLEDTTIEKKKIDTQNAYEITFSPSITVEKLVKNLNIIFESEYKNPKDIFLTNLKGLDIELITEGLKFALNYKNLKDSLMLLNILNLIKTYNTLDDSFFMNENIYISSIEDMLDLRLNLKDEIKEFNKKLSMYFISLIKSYNKTTFLPTDKCVDLPETYKNIFLNIDLLTLSGIFSTSESFEISECFYIKDAIRYFQPLLLKNTIYLDLFNELNNHKD